MNNPENPEYAKPQTAKTTLLAYAREKEALRVSALRSPGGSAETRARLQRILSRAGPQRGRCEDDPRSQ